METRSEQPHLRAAKAWERRRAWIPTLYLLRGIPYVAMLALFPIILNRMGLSNGLNVFCCSGALLPFILRPLLSRFTRGMVNSRTQILLSELLMGLLFVAMGIALKQKHWLPLFILLFYAEAVMAAIHDTGATRYLLLCTQRQSIRKLSTARAVALCAAFVLALGIPAMLGGNMEVVYRRVAQGWSTVCRLIGIFILLLSAYHAALLPSLGEQRMKKRTRYAIALTADFRKLAARRYFRFELLFLLLFLLPEGFFYRVGILFLADPGSNGGLSLSPQEIAFAQGTVGAFGLLLGCLAGGRCIHFNGFRYWLWPMTLALTLPKVFYLMMAYTLTTSLGLITVSVFLEQAGVGFGVMAFVSYLAHLSRGYHPVMFYAYSFGLAATSIMLAGAVSGFLADYLGYRHYFILLMLLSAAPILAAALVRTEPIEGIKL